MLALQHAALLIGSGQAARVLIVSTEGGSVGLNMAQPESALLIGDGAGGGAGAGGASGSGPSRGPYRNLPEGADHTRIQGGGTLRHPRNAAVQPEEYLFDMQGLGVLKLASRVVPAFLERLRPGLSTGLAGISRVVPHQASKVGLDLLRRYGWPEDRVEVTLPTLGNVIAASLPLTLHQALRTGRAGEGDTVLMVGTGAGLTAGGLILEL